MDTHGRRYDKASVLQDVRNGPRLSADVVDGLTVRFYGDVAIAQAQEHEVGPAPDAKRMERVFTDAWVKRNGRWRIVAAEDVDPTR